MKSIKFAIVALAVLLILGGVMVGMLATKKEPDEKSAVPARPQIVAKHDLQALTLLNKGHLEIRQGNTPPDKNAPKVEDFEGRCLFVNVKQGTEIKDDMLTPKTESKLLSNAFAVSIPTTPTTFVGGHLRAGDVIDLVAVSNDGKKATRFEDLMVLNIFQANKDANLPNTITLAIPDAKRDDLPAIVGAELVITRKIR